MKNALFLFLIGNSSLSFAIGTEIYKDCQAPSQPYFEGKIRQSYMIESAEGKLKDVVHSLKNYPLREEVKELKAKMSVVDPDEKALTATEIQTKFDQMVENVHLAEVIKDFPSKKASSVIKGSPEAGLVISMDNLSQDDVDFLPENILKKLGRSVKVEYLYPQKVFDYVLSYDGEELPMAKVTRKIQKDFEIACEERIRENIYKKEVNKMPVLPRAGNGFGGATQN